MNSPQSSRPITTAPYGTTPHLIASQSNNGGQGVDVGSLLRSPDGSSQMSNSKEQLMAQRISKRAAKKAEIQEKADSHKRAGDSFCEMNNYKAAQYRYLQAIQLLSSVPEYYISLAAAYRKLTWYEEAAHAATRALTIDPKNLEARYIRGVARLEQRLLQAAQTDFETVLEYDPHHLRSMAAMAEVRQFLSQAGLEDIQEENAIADFGFPHWDYEALEVASVSDSSDCHHVGNGVPCRFYNHDGCGRGAQCPYSHAPDEKSVRDDLGKNVCIYYILDSCKFGASRCVYSHSKEALPKRGWWNSPKKVAKVKEVLEVAESNAKEQRQAEMDKRKAYFREIRSGAKPSHALENQAAVQLEQLIDGGKVRTAPRGHANEKDVNGEVEEAKEEIGEAEELKDGNAAVEEVKLEDQSILGELASEALRPKTTDKNAHVSIEGRKRLIEPKERQQHKGDGGANGDAVALINPGTKARAKRHYHYKRKHPKAPVSSNRPNAATTAEGAAHGQPLNATTSSCIQRPENA